MSLTEPVDQSRRRLLILTLASASSACTMGPSLPAGENRQNGNYGDVRAPRIGQQWVYQVRNGYTGAIVDELTETVISLSPQIEIQRKSVNEGKLPSEIHSSWGLISQDPYWTPAVKFLKPVHLWPQAADRTEYEHTQYQVNEGSGTYRWISRIVPQGAETVSLPSGRFSTLKYFGQTLFASHELVRVECVRLSTVWLSPEIGRWAMRTTSGTYFNNPGVYGDEHNEDYLRYELKSWT